MNALATLRILGALLLFLGGALLTPIPFSLYFADGAAGAFLLSSGISLTVGLLLFKSCRGGLEFSVREGFAIVTFGWLFYALFGALPFILSGAIPAPLDAVFETMSGFTTSQQAIVLQAVDRWEEIIIGDLPDVVYQGQVIDDVDSSVSRSGHSCSSSPESAEYKRRC